MADYDQAAIWCVMIPILGSSTANDTEYSRRHISQSTNNLSSQSNTAFPVLSPVSFEQFQSKISVFVKLFEEERKDISVFD